mmetsp:Transcript_38184/g.118610  ORF Transcript_38184/g.118610 Transcript_38184/m.118610 type:complete len:104 (+) Transcript_38184:556-867(+)
MNSVYHHVVHRSVAPAAPETLQAAVTISALPDSCRVSEQPQPNRLKASQHRDCWFCYGVMLSIAGISDVLPLAWGCIFLHRSCQWKYIAMISIASTRVAAVDR